MKTIIKTITQKESDWFDKSIIGRQLRNCLIADIENFNETKTDSTQNIKGWNSLLLELKKCQNRNIEQNLICHFVHL